MLNLDGGVRRPAIGTAMAQTSNTHPAELRPADTSRLLAASGNWRLLAECQFTDADLFFPISSTGRSRPQADEAKRVCARCLVQHECLAFALRTKQVHGIWGGLTEEERYRTSR
jgi:WhiB family transcriptional regulator, redox-sensing transcriptional regulator